MPTQVGSGSLPLHTLSEDNHESDMIRSAVHELRKSIIIVYAIDVTLYEMSMTLRKLVSLKVRIEYSCTAPYVQNVCTKKVLTTAATPDSMIQPALDSARLPALQPASSLLSASPPWPIVLLGCVPNCLPGQGCVFFSQDIPW